MSFRLKGWAGDDYRAELKVSYAGDLYISGMFPPGFSIADLVGPVVRLQATMKQATQLPPGSKARP